MAQDDITLTISGEEIEGGYFYFTSPEVPGFRYLGEPGEIDPENPDTMNNIKQTLMECYVWHQVYRRKAEIQRFRPVIRQGSARENTPRRMGFEADLVLA